MDIPRPTTAFTSSASSNINKEKKKKWIVTVFAKHFEKNQSSQSVTETVLGAVTNPKDMWEKRGENITSRPQSKPVSSFETSQFPLPARNIQPKKWEAQCLHQTIKPLIYIGGKLGWWERLMHLFLYCYNKYSINIIYAYNKY